jgi:hypothetical protein
MATSAAKRQGARSRGASGLAVATLLLLLALAAPACGGGDESSRSETARGTTTEEAGGAVDPTDCSAKVDHPLVPLSSISLKEFEGSEPDPNTGETIKTRAELRVLKKPAVVGGFRVAVVEVKEYEDGELVEQTLDYYTQCGDGSVWYVGEKVDEYEDGKLAGHEGQWQAGKGGAKPGLFMPVEPKVGLTFQQEQAPGVAEDRSTVVAVGVDVKTPAGEFTDCLKTEDFAPLDKITEFKFYCPKVGLVREERKSVRFDLVRYS